MPKGRSKRGANKKDFAGVRSGRRLRERADAAKAKAKSLHKQAEAMHGMAIATHHRSHAAHLKTSSLKKEGRERAQRSPLAPPKPFEDQPELVARLKKGAIRDPTARPAAHLPEPLLPFTIVGIGASAGGFEAFAEFLRRLPRNTGMAFVFVQHLDPNHESKLIDLLSKVVSIPLESIRSGLKPAPNHIYVLPSNASVTLQQGRFRLGPRTPARQPMPIDVFLRSLAQDQQHRSIGVVLSGTGTDGTLGLAEIKGHGGVTFAQDQGSAKYFGMPGSAIAAAAVDFVLPPDTIAREIGRLARHSYVSSRAQAPGEVAVPDVAEAETLFREAGEDLKTLFKTLRARTGVDFTLYKPGTLNRRIMRRLVLQKIDTVAAYVRYVQDHPGEMEALYNDLLISVTGFFRDSSMFSALQRKLLPRLLKKRSDEMPLRIWSCGCSTGEEAYSLAIAITEVLEKTQRHLPVQIFASDLNESGIEKARAGIYHENIMIDVSAERLRRFFTKVNGSYQVVKSIRDMCVFARQNVVVDPPFSNVDIISCRNVLIYLTPVLQKRVIPVFHYALKPGGVLILGSSEAIGEHSELFELTDRNNKIYTKKSVSYRPTFEFEARPVTRGLAPTVKTAVAEKVEFPDASLQQKVDRLILSRYSPPAVVINAHMDVLQFRGKTSAYLEHQSGLASLNLLKMAHEDLSLTLRRLVSKAIQTGERTDAIAELRAPEGVRQVRVEVHSLPSTPDSDRSYIVFFLDMARPGGPEAARLKPSQDGPRLDGRQMQRLREELSQTKESLQAIIEEQEATNEELKSANEEIQSSNEELQSTNEELETAREELQSTNEELTTLNQELQTRNNEMAQVNNDLTNLLASVNIAIIMLSTDLTIRRFTPAAEKIFNLIPSDVGRRLTDLNRSIQTADLEEIIHDVIENLNTVQRDVQDREGRWYSLRIRPYRTRESRIVGVVLMLFDIDEMKRSTMHIISLVRHPVITLQADLTVTRANEAFYSAFKYEPNVVEGRQIYDMGRREWSIPRLRQLLEDVLPAQGEVRDFRIDHVFGKSGPRRLSINARRFHEDSRGVQMIVLAIEDITGSSPKG